MLHEIEEFEKKRPGLNALKQQGVALHAHGASYRLEAKLLISTEKKSKVFVFCMNVK